jgi:hypothetical protein
LYVAVTVNKSPVETPIQLEAKVNLAVPKQTKGASYAYIFAPKGPVAVDHREQRTRRYPARPWLGIG